MKILGVAIVMVALLASCGDKGKKSSGSTAESNAEVAAFYYQDSIVEHFKFYKDESKELEIEMRNFQEMLLELQNDGQQKMNYLQIQQQAQALSPNQIKRKQSEIQAISDKIDLLNRTDGAELEKKNTKFAEELLEKMEQYAKEYSEENGFTILFARQKGGPILHMDESKDVTMDFIKYMNEQDKK